MCGFGLVDFGRLVNLKVDRGSYKVGYTLLCSAMQEMRRHWLLHQSFAVSPSGRNVYPTKEPSNSAACNKICNDVKTN